MPMVVRMLAHLTGKEPDCSQSPDEAVAHGAALYAGMSMAGRRRETGLRTGQRQLAQPGRGGNSPEERPRAVSVLIPKNTPCRARW